LLWIARGAIAAIVLGGILFGLDQWQFSVPLAAIAGVVAIGLVLGTVYALRLYQLWRFELQDDALYLERGVVTFVETAVPFVRVQHVDTSSAPSSGCSASRASWSTRPVPGTQTFGSRTDPRSRAASAGHPPRTGRRE